MRIVVRGNVVEFSTSFFDAAGLPTNPASVAVKLGVVSPGSELLSVELAMTESSGVWSVDWGTSEIPGGTVYWAVQATAPHAADEGFFTLTGNLANVWS